MESDHFTTSTPTDCADGPTSIKVEPDDGPQSEEQLSYQHFKNVRSIINIAPVVTSGDCASNSDEDTLTVKSKAEEEHLTVKSEPDLYNDATVTSIQTAVKIKAGANITPKLYDVKNESPCPIHTAVKSEAVNNVIPKLYEVKNESPCPIHLTVKSEAATNITPKLYGVKNESPCSSHTKIVHNDIDADSELVEVPGELDCKPEIIDNVNNVGVLGDVNIQTSVQHNDTVNHKPLLTSMNNCEVDSKETTTLGK